MNTIEQLKKHEWKLWSGAAILSILFIGLFTNFQFYDIEFDVFDTWYKINWVKAALEMTVFIIVSVYMLLITDLTINRYRILALLIAIITPIVIVLLMMLVFLNIDTVLYLKGEIPERLWVHQWIPVSIIIAVILMSIFIEIRALRKVWGLITNKVETA